MDTGPTLEVGGFGEEEDDHKDSQRQEKPKAWGRLFSLNPKIPHTDLEADEVVIGRVAYVSPWFKYLKFAT